MNVDKEKCYECKCLLFTVEGRSPPMCRLCWLHSHLANVYLLKNSFLVSGLKTLSRTLISSRSSSCTNNWMILCPKNPPAPVTRQLHPGMVNTGSRSQLCEVNVSWSWRWLEREIWWFPQTQFLLQTSHRTDLETGGKLSTTEINVFQCVSRNCPLM